MAKELVLSEGAIRKMKTFAVGKQGFVSARAYRRYIDALLRLGAAGMISMREMKAGCEAARIGCELYLAEVRLKMIQGVEDVEPEHVLGDSGGGNPEEMFQALQVLKEMKEAGMLEQSPAQEGFQATSGANDRKEITLEMEKEFSDLALNSFDWLDKMAGS